MVNWLYGNSALCHLALCNLALCNLALCNLAPCNLALCNLSLRHSALCHWALCNLALSNLARYCLPRAGGFQKAGDAGDVDELWQLETAKKKLRAATWRARVFPKAGGAGDAGDVAEQAYKLSCVNQTALAGSSSACRVSDFPRPGARG